jgi:transcriptional regulator with XRE-family HTH domain
MTKRSEPLNGLRLWREARGMSQEALARRLGVSQRTVSRIESWAQTPNRDAMRRILILTGGRVTSADFYELAPSPSGMVA